MLERELHNYIQDLIKDEKFLGKIEGKEEIYQLFDGITQDNVIQSFPIDYLARKRFVLSAKMILDSLNGCQTISSDRNVSIEMGEVLRPDLVLMTLGAGKFILIELKTSAKTEREALTELLGYEQEIRNQFPFLATTDILHVVVSTEFSHLLDHSISSLVMWEEKPFLCLKVIESSDDVCGLKVHIPSAWSPIGQAGIPKSSITTMTLCLYPKKNIFDASEAQELGKRLHIAMDLIVREGERRNSHGFAFLWEDGWQTGGESWNFTIGVINPFSFLKNNINGGFFRAQNGPIKRFFDKHELDLDSCEPSSFYEILEPVRKFLSDYCWPCMEGIQTWESEPSTLKYRAKFILSDFWGIFGEYARDFCMNRIIRSFYNFESDVNLYWKEPIMGLSMLRVLTGDFVFKGGRFNCQSIFKFSIKFCTFKNVCANIVCNEETGTNEADFSAIFQWCIVELLPEIFEIQQKIYEAKKLKTESPFIYFSNHGNSKAILASLLEFEKWFVEVFLEGFSIHQELYILGGEVVPFFDKHLRVEDGDKCDIQGESTNNLLNYSRNIMKSICDYVWDDVAGDDEQMNDALLFFNEVFLNGERQEWMSTGTSGVIDKVSDEIILELFDGKFLQFLDGFFPPVFHESIEDENYVLDWDWVFDQIKIAYKNGSKFPAIIRKADGSCGIGVIPKEARLISFRNIDHEKEVLVMIEHAWGAISTVKIEKWDEIRSRNSI
ncbi:MAG: hypothetical protein HQM06_16200 [Magnetococcales bacterium]|nr:hypothetical protein [Magnetococcales bacterium]